MDAIDDLARNPLLMLHKPHKEEIGALDLEPFLTVAALDGLVEVVRDDGEIGLGEAGLRTQRGEQAEHLLLALQQNLSPGVTHHEDGERSLLRAHGCGRESKRQRHDPEEGDRDHKSSD
ncbi:MAG: hypothetical protein EB084_26425 [Proteobacteria bacterium]|nr:hypothetical protein [Pseudomonadota bacterium]